MKIFLISLSLFLSLFLEASFIPLPFVLAALLLLTIVFQELWIFPAAFFMGIFLDMLTFRTIGMTSLFFVVVLSLVFLYKRKFEIQTIQFVVVVTFLSGLFYTLFLAGGNIFLHALAASFLGGVSFLVIARLAKFQNNFA